MACLLIFAFVDVLMLIRQSRSVLFRPSYLTRLSKDSQLARFEREHTKYPFHSEAATAGLRNATLHNTQQVNYAVFYHHVLNGNPYQRRAQKGMLSGSVFADRLFNARQDEFNFYSK